MTVQFGAPSRLRGTWRSAKRNADPVEKADFEFWLSAKFTGTSDKKQNADFFRSRNYSLDRAQKADFQF